LFAPLFFISPLSLFGKVGHSSSPPLDGVPGVFGEHRLPERKEGTYHHPSLPPARVSTKTLLGAGDARRSPSGFRLAGVGKGVWSLRCLVFESVFTAA
jgi:hypothetical protein